MSSQAQQSDYEFMQRSARLAAIWVVAIVLAGLALIVFGDTLMELFT